MKRFWIITSLLILAGCAEKPAKIEVKESNGAKTTIELPQGLAAQDLIALQTLTANAMILRADQQAKAAAAAQAREVRLERERYALYVFFSVMFGIVTMCVTAMGVVVYLTRRLLSCKKVTS